MASPIDALNPLNAVSSIADSVATGLDELFTSDEERERAKLLMMKELNQPHIIQALTNVEEAKHPSIFVAGWRPALGWLTVLLLAYAWILRDLLMIFFNGIGKPEIVAGLPPVEAGEMLTLVFALLGLGATRTFEKVKGVARSNWEPTPIVPRRAKEEGAAQRPARTKKPPEKRPKDFSEDEKRRAFGESYGSFMDGVD